MKTHIIGFLIFTGWAVLSTYLYVCKIKGLCIDPLIAPTEMVLKSDNPGSDTLSKPLIPARTPIPGTLTIYFEFDKSDISADSMTDNYISVSKEYLIQFPSARLKITGYTDAIGSDEYNQALGVRRARSSQNYFIKRGIPADMIISESRGEREPADDNSTAAGRANNRRTLTVINK